MDMTRTVEDEPIYPPQAAATPASDFHIEEYLEAGRRYVNEKPAEAVALAATVGLAAWAFLCTAPGRQALDKGVALAGPEVQKWLSRLA